LQQNIISLNTWNVLQSKDATWEVRSIQWQLADTGELQRLQLLVCTARRLHATIMSADRLIHHRRQMRCKRGYTS